MSINESHINKPNFQLPKNYFEQFGEELQAQIALEEALGGKVTAGFGTPEAYFDTLVLETDTLSRKPKAVMQTTPKVISLWAPKSLWTGISIAAVALLIFSLLWNPTAVTSDFETLDLVEIEDYMNMEELAFTTDELTDLLSDEGMNTLTENTAILDDELLINYLEESADMYQISIE